LRVTGTFEDLADLFPAGRVRRWLEGVGLGLLVLVLRGGWQDPARPYSPAAATLVVSVMAGALAFWFRRGHYVYASGLLWNIMGVLLWWAWGRGTWDVFLLTNALCLAAGSALWSAADTALRGAGPPKGEHPGLALRWGPLPYPAFAASLGLGLLALTVGLALADDLAGSAGQAAGELAWAAAAGLGLALVVRLWDRDVREPLAGPYALGLAAAGLGLHGLGLGPDRLAWAAALVLAGYVLLATLVFRMGPKLEDLARPLRLPPRGPGGTGWFLPGQAVLAGAVLALSVWVCLCFAGRADRLAGPGAVLALLAAGVLLADAAPPGWRGWLRVATLALGVLAVGEAGWAVPDPGGLAPWVQRNAWLVVGLALLTVVHGEALPRWLPPEGEWARAARRFGPLLGGLALLVLLVQLVQQLQAFNPATRHTPLSGPAVVAVLAVVALLTAAALRFAVAARPDPLGLSERGRTVYVYAAELLLVLLFVHLRLNVPELFRGLLARYWTVVLMLVAFAGVGLSELFERRGRRVLAEPLQRTGVFLPLLPLLSLWLRVPAALLLGVVGDQAPGLRPTLGHLAHLPWRLDTYAAVWFLAGLLYAWLAAARRSFRFALLAALAANCGLWSLWAHHGIAFLVHPQFWLIPLALIILASEQVQRDRLGRELSGGLRYLGISMVYVSATADLFIAGLGNSVALPVWLAVLSVGGVLAGIVLRVRAFLFLGVSFLLLDVFTMIWHAAVDRYHTWVWWASGIVLGAAVLALFGLFEKRRDDVLRLIEEVRRWD
jgi:hypothetical protein